MNGCALIRLVSSRSTILQKQTAGSSGSLSTRISYVTPHNNDDRRRWFLRNAITEPCDLTFHETMKAANTLLRTHGTSTKSHGVTAHANDRAAARCARSLSALLGPIMKTEPLGRFSRARGVGTKQGMHTLRPLCLFQTLRCQIGKR
jgi:hypothetical protein